MFSAAIKKRLLATLAGIIGFTTAALAVVQLSFSFQPQLVSGIDTNGLIGSTWTIDITLAQNNYSALTGDYRAGLPYAPIDTAILTVSGASVPANNGTFPIIDGDGGNLILIPNNNSDISHIKERVVFLSSESAHMFPFQFGTADFQYLHFGSQSTPPVAMPNPGDFIQAEHFDGLSVDPVYNSYGGPDVYYHVQAGTTVSAVPEPGTWAAMIGLVGFGMAIYYTARRTEKSEQKPDFS